MKAKYFLYSLMPITAVALWYLNNNYEREFVGPTPPKTKNSVEQVEQQTVSVQSEDDVSSDFFSDTVNTGMTEEELKQYAVKNFDGDVEEARDFLREFQQDDDNGDEFYPYDYYDDTRDLEILDSFSNGVTDTLSFFDTDTDTAKNEPEIGVLVFDTALKL